MESTSTKLSDKVQAATLQLRQRYRERGMVVEARSARLDLSVKEAQEKRWTQALSTRQSDHAQTATFVLRHRYREQCCANNQMKRVG